jgi:hypothetical protein
MKLINNMLNKLDPRVKELMDQDEKEFPNLIRRMKREIENAKIIGDLTIMTAENLLNYYDQVEEGAEDLRSSRFVLKLYNIFGK